MTAYQTLQQLKDKLKLSSRMPLVFLGHGSPMNAIEENEFSLSWKALGCAIPRPQAILLVSAHWVTHGSTLVNMSEQPRTIHDFYGFPGALFNQQYPAQGEPKLAGDVVSLLAEHQAKGDQQWGLDHGAWSVLKHLYPKADVPVFQLSIDISKTLAWHLTVGKTLSELRDRGVLLLGSGNVVHNLHALSDINPPQDWALEFDSKFAERLTARDFNALANHKSMGPLMRMAHPTQEHYIPALTIAGASEPKEQLYFVTEGFDLGSLSMRSFVFHNT